MEDFRIKSSVLADLGPLPEVVESDSETTWKMFVQLQAQQSASFSKTAPGHLGFCCHDSKVSVDDVMAVARRFNRICPKESEWERFHEFLAQVSGAAPPNAVRGAQFRRTPPLAKRIRMREQIEWAAQRGLVEEVHAYLASLSEDQWVHIAD